MNEHMTTELTDKKAATTQLALFGAGCFWGVEATFRQTNGVKATAVGYAGGALANPSYEDVCYRRTGHAEVVQVEFDPTEISYEALLGVFFENHDPTTLNRQGPDVGDQYRSAIFYYDDSQRDAATALKERLDGNGAFRRPIVTQIAPAATFFRAEEYHQRYLEKRGLASCHI
jgi:peptide-methionine (S)-S-oxide reductase